MKRLFVVSVIAVAAGAVSGPVAASPPGLGDGPPSGLLGKGDAYVCDDVESIVFGGSGRSGWLDGSLYQATAVSGSFTYDPGDGAITESFARSWGNGPSSGDTVTCIRSDSGEGWSEEVTVTVVRVPGG